jgi:hypothetical protein
MTQIQATSFTTVTGRLVWGDLYEPRTTDYDGNPLTVKSGPDTGKLTQRFEFGFAVKKNPGEQHWANSALGAIIWAQGHKDHPAAAQRPDFAWKVVDGDSTIPNRKGNKPCDKEGFPGHWVFTFSSTYAPRIVNANGSAYILEKDAVNPGDYVQVAGSVAGNTGATPGVYLNHNFVALQGHGEPIVNGPDPKTLGFGGGPQPAGMSSVPVGSMSAPPVTPVPPQTVVVAPPIPPAAVPAPAAAPAPVVTPVVPHPGILATPTPPPVAPAAPVGPVMTAKANGTSYAAFIAAGWTDETLRANGYLA